MAPVRRLLGVLGKTNFLTTRRKREKGKRKKEKGGQIMQHAKVNQPPGRSILRHRDQIILGSQNDGDGEVQHKSMEK